MSERRRLDHNGGAHTHWLPTGCDAPAKYHLDSIFFKIIPAQPLPARLSARLSEGDNGQMGEKKLIAIGWATLGHPVCVESRQRST